MKIRDAGRVRFCFAGIALALALAGCSSVPLTEEAAPAAAAAGPAPVARTDVPALPPAGSGRGGYYQDDGPGEAAPADLLATPDAVPRIEPIGKSGNRSYVVFGKTYTPITDDRPYKERGRGSWYGKKFHGQKTSSGELYDMYKMTAAHPTLPLPSYARVTNLENGRQVIVRINDRGPFLAGRIIDLSYTAALKLGYLEKGSALLEVERLLPDDIRRMTEQRPQPVMASGGVETVQVAAAETPERSALPAPQLVPASAAGAPVSGAVYLQLGAFGQPANAEAHRSRFAQRADIALPPVEVVEQGALYRVYSGPFASRAEAEAAAQRLERSEAVTPLIVQR